MAFFPTGPATHRWWIRKWLDTVTPAHTALSILPTHFDELTKRRASSWRWRRGRFRAELFTDWKGSKNVESNPLSFSVFIFDIVSLCFSTNLCLFRKCERRVVGTKWGYAMLLSGQGSSPSIIVGGAQFNVRNSSPVRSEIFCMNYQEIFLDEKNSKFLPYFFSFQTMWNN